ncbi:MAG: hypothetical protein IPN89_10830 [Saprospiraceae bacterium]|nr:hypothetical protein [Saprospiraceae bacterium]
MTTVPISDPLYTFDDWAPRNCHTVIQTEISECRQGTLLQQQRTGSSSVPARATNSVEKKRQKQHTLQVTYSCGYQKTEAQPKFG